MPCSQHPIAVCSNPCQNSGTCSAPNTCNCVGTGYTGATCTVPGERGKFLPRMVRSHTPGKRVDWVCMRYAPVIRGPLQHSYGWADGSALCSIHRPSTRAHKPAKPLLSRDPLGPNVAVCASPCLNGGACSSPNTCSCTGTGYSGATCNVPGEGACKPA